MSETRHHAGVVTPDLAGRRLDQALAALFDDYSRTLLAGWIRDGRVLLNGRKTVVFTD